VLDRIIRGFSFRIKGLAMPIYAYRCESCGHAKDVLQKISDPVLTTCPACGAESFKKQVTAAGFQLKGSGWYVTDFRGGSTSAAPDAPASADAKAPAKEGEGKSDAKTDAAAPAPALAPAPAASAPPASGTSGTSGTP
jgi:putative FmdB family regulatory protein